MLGTVDEFVYKYGNRLVRKLRNFPLESMLGRHQVRFITRQFDLDGIKFLLTLNMKDKGLSRQLLSNDWREYNSTRYFRHSFLNTNEVILDIGANLGYFAVLEAVYSPDNLVYAVEPVPENYALLQANIILNNLHNVQPVNVGISNTNESKEIIICDYLNWSTFNRELFAHIENTYGNSRREKVFVMTLSEFEKRHVRNTPTMVRIDVEGFEYEILTGNRDFFTKHDLKLFIEFHTSLLGKEKAIELLRLLKETGYEIDRYITNLEYCGHDLVFGARKGKGVKRQVTIDQFIDEILQREESEIRENEGCELFFIKE